VTRSALAHVEFVKLQIVFSDDLDFNRARFPLFHSCPATTRPPTKAAPASGAIIERVRTGASARWASNHESPLALLECGGYDSRGAALNARRRFTNPTVLSWVAPEFSSPAGYGACGT
jgi:hypothetical protein